MNRRDFVSTLLASAAAADLGAEESNLGVKRVLVMFKCHLDIGFVDTQAAIIRKYFDEYFPQAIATAAAMREAGGDKYVWTTGSWLLFSYLQQASAEQADKMEQAIERGDIAWHALPFTWQSELLDRSAIKGCLGFSKSLDKRFGKKTTGCKMSDVPGHTRGLVSPLAAAGVTFLNIGVNSASTPPDVPEIFVWKDKGGSQITVMYHRAAYGGEVVVPGSDLAIAVEVRDDNGGPHTLPEIQKIYRDLRARYPAAEIKASNLTEMAEVLLPYQKNFPVVTKEIGDTWIYGVPSDPIKLSRYRELLRLRAAWVKRGSMVPGDASDLAFLQKFSLAVEHTWGTDTKTWLDFDHYTPAALASMLDNPKYKTVAGSWVEKRRDIQDGVAALPPDLRREAETQLAALVPKRPVERGLSPLEAGTKIESKRFRLGIDERTGAIIHLEDKSTGRLLASPAHPLGLFTYQTYSKADYDRFLASYITLQTDWAPKDFGKPNIQSFGARSQQFNPSSAKTQHRDGHIVIELSFGDQADDAVTAWPEVSYLVIEIEDEAAAINMDLSWFQKRANRMPEALWLTFKPPIGKPQNWTMSKLEQQVSPFDVVNHGNRHMHALTGPMTYRDGDNQLSIESLDAAVVSLGVMSAVAFSNTQPDLSEGFHYSLFNNGWGTNYIQWFGEDARFRFRVSI